MTKLPKYIQIGHEFTKEGGLTMAIYKLWLPYRQILRVETKQEVFSLLLKDNIIIYGTLVDFNHHKVAIRSNVINMAIQRRKEK